MADQEFSSPGEHMASRSSGSSGLSPGTIATSVGFAPGESNVFYSPGAFDNFNRGYSLHHDEVYGSSARERADRYNQVYMNYNSQLFNNAKEYDMYMSNSAIQRQVEDLKKAGLNPILAARLGGAAYKGVNAPYLSIAPSSALNAFLDFGSSLYATDVNASTTIENTRLHNASNEFIAQYNKTMELYMQGRLFEHEEEMVELKRDAERFLDAMSHLDDKDLEAQLHIQRKDLEEFKKFLEEGYSDFTHDINQKEGMFNFLNVVANLLKGIGAVIPN